MDEDQMMIPFADAGLKTGRRFIPPPDTSVEDERKRDEWITAGFNKIKQYDEL